MKIIKNIAILRFMAFTLGVGLTMTSCQKDLSTPSVSEAKIDNMNNFAESGEWGHGEGNGGGHPNNSGGLLPYTLRGCVVALTKDAGGNSYIYDVSGPGFDYNPIPCNQVMIKGVPVTNMTGLAYLPKSRFVGITDASATTAGHRNRIIYFIDPCKAVLGPQLRLNSTTGAVVNNLSDIEYDARTGRCFAIRGKNRVAMVDVATGTVVPLPNNVAAGKTALNGLATNTVTGEIYVENSVVSKTGALMAEIAKVDISTGLSVSMPATTLANKWFGVYMPIKMAEMGLHYDNCGGAHFLAADMATVKGAYGNPFIPSPVINLATPTQPTVDFAYVPY